MRTVRHRRFLILGLFEYFDHTGTIFRANVDYRLISRDLQHSRAWPVRSARFWQRIILVGNPLTEAPLVTAVDTKHV
jgi:hypothetical protein